MTLLDEVQIRSALRRLGALAAETDEHVEILLLGGAAMALAYHARRSTRDVDVVILAPTPAIVRRLATQVAEERHWPSDWLNDAAKGYLVGLNLGDVVLQEPGITVRVVGPIQLLAMKLSAWRDDVDVADARLLLQAVAAGRSRHDTWTAVQAHLVPGDELKAEYAFADLWEDLDEHRR